MMSAVQLRLGRVLAGLLVLLLGPALLPASAASAAADARTGVGAASSTQLSGFNTSRAAVRVGGALWDAVTVSPRAARTVTVQYRLAGAARFTTASSGRSSATGLFAARLKPRSAGVWKFRLVVAAASGADRMVSRVRTVKASGRAANTVLRAFVTTPATINVGGTVAGAVTVLPRAHRTVLVQARRPGAQQFATVSTGRSSSAGVFRAVYRPTTAGVWAYRLLVRASTTARMAVSSPRIVTVTTPPTTTPPTTTPPTTTPPTTTPPTTNTAPGPVTGLTLVSKTSSTMTLAWTNPTAPDFAGVMIRRLVGATAPASPTDGALVTKTGATATSFTDSGLAPSKTFAYALFAFDTAANFSSRATGDAITGKATTAVLTINGSTGPTAKLTEGESQNFGLGGSAGLGLTLLGGTLFYGDGASQSFTGGDPAFWIPDAHQYTVKQGQSALFPAATWRVFDSAGGSDLTNIDITVFNAEPTATLKEVPTGHGGATVGTPVLFDVSSFTPTGTSYSSYDLSSLNPDGVSFAKGSVFAALGQPPVAPTLTFDTAGDYVVTLVVDNDAGGEATVTATVTVK